MLWSLWHVCSCSSVLCAAQLTVRELSVDILVLWISHIILPNLTSISTLTETGRTNRRSISLSLNWIRRVDMKLFQWNYKENTFRHGRTSLILLLTMRTTMTAHKTILFFCVFPSDVPVYMLCMSCHRYRVQLSTGQWSCNMSA